ncbi:MAG: hypothetical protein HQM13_08425 [SAR324 cluster bacterium]|nr:hypothetical protein [SAR324 cluster bacterium]
MSLKINHNVNHLNTTRNLAKTARQLEVTSERLASGVAASASVDGGAVLSLTERLRAEIAGLNQASQNTEAANSMIQVAEQSLVEVSTQIQNLRSLAVQAADPASQSDWSRDVIQKEVDNVLETIDRIAGQSSFGSKRLFDGSSQMEAVMEGEGFNFISGVALTDHELNKPLRVIVQQSATQNTTLGEIDFSEVLDREETMIISEGSQKAVYTVNPEFSEEENLTGLRNAVRNAGVNVDISLEGGALRTTHNQNGSAHVFRVQSETSGLLSGGDDQNTEARIRRDVEEGVLERDKTVEFLKDAASIGFDVATGAGLLTIVIKNTPAFKGLQEDLINASKEGFSQFKNSVLQQLELLNEFEFIVPSKFALQPQSVIRLNQKQIVDYAIAQSNRREGLNSLALGDLAEKLLNQLDADKVVGSQSQSGMEKAEKLLHELGTRMGEGFSLEVMDGIKFLVGKDDALNLSAMVQKGIPALFQSTMVNVGLPLLSEDLSPTASNQEVLSFLQKTIPDFVENLPVRDRVENMIGILNPLEADGGLTLDDFKISAASSTSAFINNGRDTIGYFDEELAVGSGRIFSGTRKLAGIQMRYDGVLEPGDKAEGALIIQHPGLSFQVGSNADHQALFGLPNISTFQLARGINNSSAYTSLADIDFSTAEGASDAIGLLDAANEEIASLRGTLGIFGSALESNTTALQGLVQDSSDAENQIAGADYAEESLKWLQTQLQTDYQNVAAVHGNLSSENVLRLVKSIS